MNKDEKSTEHTFNLTSVSFFSQFRASFRFCSELANSLRRWPFFLLQSFFVVLFFLAKKKKNKINRNKCKLSISFLFNRNEEEEKTAYNKSKRNNILYEKVHEIWGTK